MRGEKENTPLRHWTATGSSPHARGKVHNAGIVRVPGRIIPACAGKSFLLHYGSETAQDHPRMRGEKSPLFHSMLLTSGSSPHARGKVL